MTSLSATTAPGLAAGQPRPRTCRPCAASPRRHPLRLAAVMASGRRPGGPGPPGLAAAQGVPQGAAAGRRRRRPHRARSATSSTSTPTSPTAATTVTWLAARLHGPSVLVHRPRQGHLPPRRSTRPGCSRASCGRRRSPSRARAPTSTTCERSPPTTPVHLVYHGLNPDFARLVARRCRRSSRRPASASSASGGWSRRRASTCSSTRSPRSATAASTPSSCSPARTGRPPPTSTPLIAARGLADGRRADAARSTKPGCSSWSPAASVFALACRVAADGDRDGIPNVLVEAMAAGVPVVSTTVSGIPELVSDGVDGLLVAPEDPAALAAALRRLALDDDLRRAPRLPPGGRRSPTASTATCWPVRWPTCCRCRHDRRRPSRAPQRVVCVVDEARRDRRRGRRRRRRPVHPQRRHPRPRCRPDWIAGGLAHDVEWRIEWVKPNEGLDLAHAYAVTGDEHLPDDVGAARARRTRSRCRSGYERSEVSARRMQNWLYAWQRFRDAGAPRPRRRRRCCAPGCGPTPTTSPPTSRPSATTARSSCTRCCSWGWRSTTDARARRALDDLAANAAARHPARRRPPRALERLPPDRRCARSSAPSPTPGPRGLAVPPDLLDRTRPGMRRSRCTCNDRTA